MASIAGHPTNEQRRHFAAKLARLVHTGTPRKLAFLTVIKDGRAHGFKFKRSTLYAWLNQFGLSLK